MNRIKHWFNYGDCFFIEIDDEHYTDAEYELFVRGHGEYSDLKGFIDLVNWLSERKVNIRLILNSSHKRLNKKNYKFVKKLQSKHKLIPQDIEVLLITE